MVLLFMFISYKVFKSIIKNNLQPWRVLVLIRERRFATQTSTRQNLTEPTEITENESVTKAVFAANPLGESPLFFGYDIFSFLVRIFRCGFLFNCFFAFVLLLLCSLRPYSSLRPSTQSHRTIAIFYLLFRSALQYHRPEYRI